MTDLLVHRCRLYDFTPCAIHGIATTSGLNDVAISRSNGNIEIWCTYTNLHQKMVIPGSGSSVEALQWIGDRLVSGGINGEIREYDLRSATTKLSVDSFGGAVWCLSCSPDKKRLAAGCEDGSIKLFDVESDAIKYEKAFDKQEGRILSMSWYPGGGIIATGSVDIIRLWSVSTGHALQKITIERLSRKVETIIWSVIMLSDYTVISGDSYGRVQFWNGKNGTLLSSHQVHRADVLCMCLGEDETSVYAAGVDSKVIEFNFVSTKNSASWKVGRHMQKHSHDIRAVGIAGGRVFSGGVDTTLCMRPIHPKPKQDRFFQTYSFPLRNHVSLSRKANLLLLQYPNHLDLWKIAESNKPENFEAGQFVPIERNPIKLIKINKPSSDPNVLSCSSLSPCGRWLAYSTRSTTRLYRISQPDDDVVASICRVHCLGMTSAHVIIFTPDSSHMIISSTNHKLLLIKLNFDSNEAALQQSSSLQNTDTISNLLAVSSDSKLLAIASLDGQVDIFDVNKLTHICSLPRRQEIPTAISFVTERNQIIIAYAKMTSVRFDLKRTAKKDSIFVARVADTTQLLRIRNHSPHRYHAVITHVFYRVRGKTITTYFVSTEGIYVIEKTENISRMRFCQGFALLLFGDLLDNDTLFVVERTAHDVYLQLPPTLYQKKFGM